MLDKPRIWTMTLCIKSPSAIAVASNVESKQQSKRMDQRFPRCSLMVCHRAENGIQCTEPDGWMRRRCDAMLRWLGTLQNDMASRLVNPFITPASAERFTKLLS